MRLGAWGWGLGAGRAFALAGAFVLAMGVIQPASAQTREPKTQLSIGGIWAGGSGLGSSAATETRNQTGGDRYTLFKTTSELEAAGGLEARLTYWLTRTIGLEAGASWSTPRLVTRVSGDVEGAADISAEADVTQYVIDGSVVVRLNRLTMVRGRVVPFLVGGAGYLRQLYEGNVFIETGTMYHAGGGALVWFTPTRRGWLKRTGVRVEGRWTAHDGGVDFGCDCRRSFGVFTAVAALQF